MSQADERFDAHAFPATTEELIAEHGDIVLDLPNGEETLGEALSRLGDEEFQNAEGAKLAARSAVSEKGVGRKFYSDRSAPTLNDVGPEDVSF